MFKIYKNSTDTCKEWKPVRRLCWPSGVAVRFRGGVENQYLVLHLTAVK